MKPIRPISNQSDAAEKCRFDLRDENTPRTDPFLVPENYFDELPQRMMDRIAADTQQKQENPQPSPFLRKVWMIAAAAAAIAVVFMMIKPAPVVPTANAPVVNSTEAAGLPADYDQTIADEALLLEENKITDKDISAIDYETMESILNSSDTTSVTHDDIIQYLLDENYDTDLLADL